MNIREAILKAADSIDRDTSTYNFAANCVHPCGTPMCLFGWIGHHLGMSEGALNMHVAYKIGLRHTGELYSFMTNFSPFFTCDSRLAAAGLRKFADERYPSPCSDLIPASVRNIFTMTPEQIGREFAKL